ncbi:hypothetical protein GCM10023205_78820 [Yinghuangia aomiensis]|uniref:HTH cro/C1-type domain-containing protein n=1 Tax=Yinghuangia aomiensis TaxID=676205 RepID=A0ABP9ID95_9ACTN
MPQTRRQSIKDQQRQLREELAAQDLGIDRIAAEMGRQFRLRPRSAYRVAHGWTQEAAADRYNRAAAACGVDADGAASMDGPRISNIESWPQGGRRPTLPVLRVLAAAYGTTADQLIDVEDRRRMPAQDLLLLGDMTRMEANASATIEATAASGRSVPLVLQVSTPPTSLAPRHEPAAGADPMAALRSARRLVDRTLATGTVTHKQLDHLALRLEDYRAHYTMTPPAAVLPELLADVLEAQAIAADRQPGLVQLRLSENIALLASLVADALMKLGAIHEATGWHRTARAAAEDTGDPELQARTLVHAAMLPYYFGVPEHSLRLAREARQLLSQQHSAVAASAAAAEARAAARSCDFAVAVTAMAEAQRLFDLTQSKVNADQADAFGFPERRLLLYMSGTLTYLGELKAARAAQVRAKAMYPPSSGIDPALLDLDEAVCYLHEHALSDACELAISALQGVPTAHRTLILNARAQHVLDGVPVALRSAPVVKELHEVLALPAGGSPAL